ncbi:carboxypeptidase-like regulatory domain-containing protein [Bacteroides thetaiotaomicron]|nr:carboxypeptidase-like regulatory domain-containing protein [Bacteroides thetaiotaomicron]
MTRTYLFLLLMVLASTASSYAQNVVKGMVMDIADNPLPGVSVVVKGSTTGTTTDLDGRYSINVPKNETLVFTYIGMVKSGSESLWEKNVECNIARRRFCVE